MRWKEIILESVSQSEYNNAYSAAEPYVTENIRELEDIWNGGVSNFGDPRAAQYITDQKGYYDYISAFRDSFNYPITVYRYGPIKKGPMAVTTNLDFAKKFANFAGHKNNQQIHELIIEDPFQIIMRGKYEEDELVINL